MIIYIMLTYKLQKIKEIARKVRKKNQECVCCTFPTASTL